MVIEEYSAMDLRMKIADVEPKKAAALWGSPGVITAMNAYFEKAIFAEREACAKIAESFLRGGVNYDYDSGSGSARGVAEAIRQR